MSAQKILSIAYDPILGKTRHMILKKAGYSARSVLGNDAGMRAAKGGRFAMFIVGYAAPEAERMKMIRWLKQNYPKIPVLALLPSAYGRRFGDADYVATADPDEWLPAVAECVKANVAPPRAR